jgi:hypothetical protein
MSAQSISRTVSLAVSFQGEAVKLTDQSRQFCHTRGYVDPKWQLVAEQEPAPGSHLVTPRRGYLHHGIYVRGGMVVHYAGLAHGLRRGPVEQVSLASFARGQPVWVRPNSQRDFDRREVIRRALSRVGENRYRLLTNNCEHFCEWCLRDEPRSFQVEAWRRRPVSTLRATIGFMVQPLFPAP